MGVSCMGLSRSSFSTPPIVNPNPDPSKYTVLRAYDSLTGNIVLEIQYTGCTNYEGKKILLFRNVTLSELLAQRKIDPHFCENSIMHSPFARFEPTADGWGVAVKLASLL